MTAGGSVGRLRRAGLWLVIAVALGASASGLRNEFAYDDVPVIVENEAVHTVRAPWVYFAESYWGSDRGNSLYRPLAVLAYALEWAVGDGSPLPFHLTNILLYALVAALVFLLMRTLLGEGFGLVAALAWAAHPTHVEAVANVVGQSEMLAALPMLGAVLLYVRARTAGALDGRTTLGLVALFLAGLFTKEHGIVLPGLLIACEGAFRGTRFPVPAGGAGLARLGRWLLLSVLAYFTLRLAVLGTFTGDTPHPAFDSVSFIERQWVVLGVVPELARLMLWPARLLADYSPPAIPLLTAPAPAHLLGAAILLGYLGALGLAWRRSRAAFFGLLWFPIAYAPVANVVFASGIILAERTLFLPSVGVLLALGAAARGGWPAIAALPTRAIRVAVPLAGVVLLAAAILQSAARQRVWADNPTLFATTVADAPDNFRVHYALGAFFALGASWEKAHEHLRTADSLFPGSDQIELSLARVHHIADRCPEAVPLYQDVLTKQPDLEIAAVGLIACSLEMRHFSRARDISMLGLASGFSPEVLRSLLQKAESALVANDTVDARNRWARAGKPTSKSEARLRVPVLLMMPEGARRRRGAQAPFATPSRTPLQTP